MKNVFSGLVTVLVLCLVSPASAGVITIDARSDIWAAGQVGPLPDGLGLVPPYLSFAAGSVLWVQFDSITGTVDCGGVDPLGCTAHSGDGFPFNGGGTNIKAPDNSGLSGIEYIGQAMFLIGVFLTDSPPSGVNPGDYRIYTDALASGASFSPTLGQLFFVGDGQGSGGMQRFIPPGGATRLYLGFADGQPNFGYADQPTTPNSYGDNSGSLAATFDLVTPEPGSIFLMGLGVAALALLRRRRA
jgi:hypothetical protein